MGLTADEWVQVEAAYQSGLEKTRLRKSEEKDFHAIAREIRHFSNAWKKMSLRAQHYVVREADSKALSEGKLSRFPIEIRIDEALWCLTAQRGRPASLANIQAAEVLADLWTARGGEIKPGRLYGLSGSDYSPNAFIKFIASALRPLDPTLKTDGVAARRAKSAVDALRKMGRL